MKRYKIILLLSYTAMLVTAMVALSPRKEVPVVKKFNNGLDRVQSWIVRDSGSAEGVNKVKPGDKEVAKATKELKAI